MALGRHMLFLAICLEETYIISHHQYMEFIDSLHSSLVVITQLITETYLGFTDIEGTQLQGILFKMHAFFYGQPTAVRFQYNGYLAAKTVNVH